MEKTKVNPNENAFSCRSWTFVYIPVLAVKLKNSSGWQSSVFVVTFAIRDHDTFATVCNTAIAPSQHASSGQGRLSAWHFPRGPVGPPARWAATSHVEKGSGTEEGPRGP